MIDTKLLQGIGLNLFPLRPNRKEPLPGVDWKVYQTEKYWKEFPSNCNVAVICGAISNNTFVVDLDSPSLYEEFSEYHGKTRIIESGKGHHLYFRVDGFMPPGKKGLTDDKFRTIDIKSEGGYVLAEGSYYIPTEAERTSKKYPVEKENGFTYKLICDAPILTINPQELKDKLEKMGFNITNKSFDEIKQGISEGGRNDSTFKFACYLIREGVYGEALKVEIEKLNTRHKPPLPQGEIELIIHQALQYEGKHIAVHAKEVKEYQQEMGNDPEIVKMQEIDPQKHEGVILQFDAMITAVGERQTYTISAEYECIMCDITRTVDCDEYHVIPVPFCMKHKRPYRLVKGTLETSYIQQCMLEEFLEDAKSSSPIPFNAEITDENVGEAFMGDRKTITARFRSIPQRKGYNIIVFDILSMTDLEQKDGCMPKSEEVEKWKKDSNIFETITSSIAPDILVDPKIIESLILWATGGNTINDKRSLIHMCMIGDAQLAKSDLLLKMHGYLPGSGFTVGMKTSGAGLTIGMVKMYNGTSVPRAGFFPMHTGHPCIIDEGDKMKPEDQNSCLDVMEQGTTTLTKNGVPSLTLPTKVPLLFAGNPKNGKFNPKAPSIMDNFNMETPFVSRFDLLWLMVDANDPKIDTTIRKYIRSFEKRKSEYMQKDEIQRYFTYVRSLSATIPEELRDKIDELHAKIRPLNKLNGLPIGWRQYHGLYRLITASATAHLRTVATIKDFELVESVITASLKSMKMDVESGELEGSILKVKDTKANCIMETWTSCMDKELDNTVDDDEFIEKLSNTTHFNILSAGIEFKRMYDQNQVLPSNDYEGRYHWRSK